MFRVINAMATVVVVVASLLLFSGHAYGHERRNVGPYQFVVGWLTEPAFAGNTNGLDLRVTDTRTNTPVEGLEKTLTAAVSAGGVAALSLTLTARFGTPGAYNGHFVPTTSGAYVFDIRGKIAAQDVSEKFESGPGRFNDVETTTALQYPTKVPVADDLAKKLDAISSVVDQTRIIAIIALVLGVVALGGAGLMRRRSK